MTPEQGLLDLETTYKRELAMGWAFIRKLTVFVEMWGPAYIYQVADHLNRQPKTLQNYVSLARNPISHYAESLSLSRQHAGAVLGLDEEEAKALLLKAAEEGLSDDWLRYEARARKTSTSSVGALPPTGKQEAQPMDVRTYGETLTAIDDGGTQHRPNGVDPWPGVTVAEEPWDESAYTYGDDVPFALPPDPVEGADDDTAFDVAERMVARWGVLFARQVADEVVRWGEWR